jgi:hypothetical protein
MGVTGSQCNCPDKFWILADINKLNADVTKLTEKITQLEKKAMDTENKNELTLITIMDRIDSVEKKSTNMLFTSQELSDDDDLIVIHHS